MVLKTTFPCTDCSAPGQLVRRLRDGERVKCPRCAELGRLYSLANWAVRERSNLGAIANCRPPTEPHPQQVPDVDDTRGRLVVWLLAVGKSLTAAFRFAEASKLEFRARVKARTAQNVLHYVRLARRDLEALERFALEVEEEDRFLRAVEEPAQGELPDMPAEPTQAERPALHLVHTKEGEQ